MICYNGEYEGRSGRIIIMLNGKDSDVGKILQLPPGRYSETVYDKEK